MKVQHVTDVERDCRIVSAVLGHRTQDPNFNPAQGGLYEKRFRATFL